MHAPQGPATGPSRADADADGRRTLPRLTLRGRRNGGNRDAEAADPTTSAAPADAARPRRAGTTTLVDTVDEPDDVDWRSVTVFGAGLALGAVLGAAAALLLAPSSGFETRMRLARNARRAGERAADRVDELGDRVRHGARRSRRNLERKIVRARWRAQDAWERKRYGEE